MGRNVPQFNYLQTLSMAVHDAQEPGSNDQIKAFAKDKGATFTLFDKVPRQLSCHLLRTDSIAEYFMFLYAACCCLAW